MTTQHTPGPWKVDVGSLKPDGTPYAYYIIKDAPGWDCVASTFVDANLANARLIAAAPNIYKAASDLLQEVRERYEISGDELFQCDYMNELEDSLKRARGES